MKTYTSSIKKQFDYYKLLGDSTINQLNIEQLFFKPDEESNSIAIIIKHLVGNMLSRWTNFYDEDGEKTWRNRDQEFEIENLSKEKLIELWETGWDCLFNVINNLEEANLEKTIYIRNMGHSVIEAINRQLPHYAYHIGQIVFLGKMNQKDNWKSLSIPKGKSSTYNKEKFAKPKTKKHFTDDL